MLPRTNNINLSKLLNISDEGWWIVLTIVLPFYANLFNKSITYNAVDESKPVVGSSKKIKLGLVSNSTPILALFLSPPDTPLIYVFPTLVSAHLVKPSSLISDSTR